MQHNISCLTEARLHRSLANIQFMHDPIKVVSAYFDCAKLAVEIIDSARRASALQDLERRIKSYADVILDLGYDGDKDAALADPRITVLSFALGVCREAA